MKAQTVTELTAHIKQILEHSALLENVLVAGEVSNFKLHVSGHCYFTLKDSNSVIRSVMFRSKAAQLRFNPRNGMQVLAFGRVAVYERDGNYQLYAERLIPAGIGDLWLAIEQLRERLKAEGLFDRCKRSLPVLPRRVCVVAAAGGAAVRDIFAIAERRNPGVQLLLVPSLMQGAMAVQTVIAAIQLINRHNLGEVIIIARGGGSLEDLMPFNNEEMLRAIAQSAVPVISAIGHETDYTLSDYVADVRAATPSQAAEIAIPEKSVLFANIVGNTRRLETFLKGFMTEKRERVRLLLGRRVLSEPAAMWETRRLNVDNLVERLAVAMPGYMQKRRSESAALAGKLAALNPLAAFGRGFAVVEQWHGGVVKSVKILHNGDIVKIRFADGSAKAGIMEISGESHE